MFKHMLLLQNQQDRILDVLRDLFRGGICKQWTGLRGADTGFEEKGSTLMSAQSVRAKFYGHTP